MKALALALTVLVVALSSAALVVPSAASASQRRSRIAHITLSANLTRALIRSAIGWARQQIGAVTTQLNPYASWWSGYCEAFVERAYKLRFSYGSAYSDYLAERRLGRVHHGVPPRGALVFYNGVYGHVALSVGGGWVISAIGGGSDRLPVARVPYRWFYSAYLGWAMPIIHVA